MKDLLDNDYVRTRRERDGYTPRENDPDTLTKDMTFFEEFQTRTAEVRGYQLDRWGLKHDDEKISGNIQSAAIVYLARSMGSTDADIFWPWTNWPIPVIPTTAEQYEKLMVDAAAMITAEYTKYRRESEVETSSTAETAK